MQEALAVILAPTLESALVGANQTKAAEAAGRGGRTKPVFLPQPELETGLETGNYVVPKTEEN
jgi:hypothetical protein